MSSPLAVTDPAAVRLLMRGRTRRVLGAFLAGESSVSGAARRTGTDIRVVHRAVLALTGAGLLSVQREEKRAGRAIKVYAAVASAFFVPFSATDAATLDELSSSYAGYYAELFRQASAHEFDRLHREQAAGREWGVRLYLAPEGHWQTDTSYEGAELIDAAVRYQGPVGLMLDANASVTLSEEEAKAVQHELILLLMRLRPLSLDYRQAGTGEPYLLRLGLVPITAEEGEQLHARAGQQ